MPTATTRRCPLAITADPDLLDDLLRIAAAGGVELQVATDPAAARRAYVPAPLVLVGLDVAESIDRARLPRRAGVVLVGRSGVADPWVLAEALGAQHVAVLPAAEPWLVGRFTEVATARAVSGRLVAVIGGRGGAGASVLAAGLATTAVRSRLRTFLVDADPLGGGIDLALGWEDQPGPRWPGSPDVGASPPTSEFVEELPRRGALVVLSWDREAGPELLPEVMSAAILAGQTHRDLVVVDLPRRLDEAATLALQAADQAIMVVPAELRATAAASRVAATVLPHCASLGLVVRGPTPGRLRPKDVAKALGLPLLGVLRPEPSLPLALERGEAPTQSGRGPLATLCRQLVADLCGPAREAAAA